MIEPTRTQPIYGCDRLGLVLADEGTQPLGRQAVAQRNAYLPGAHRCAPYLPPAYLEEEHSTFHGEWMFSSTLNCARLLSSSIDDLAKLFRVALIVDAWRASEFDDTSRAIPIEYLRKTFLPCVTSTQKIEGQVTSEATPLADFPEPITFDWGEEEYEAIRAAQAYSDQLKCPF